MNDPDLRHDATGAGADDDSEDAGRIGIFPSWGSLYASVVIYTVALIVILYVFSVLLDFSG